MSHKLAMYAYNNTSHTINSFNITHSWDDNTDTLEGKNLKSKGESASKEVTTGYGPERDWYTIQVDIDTIGNKSTDFYCDSSQDHRSVVISFHDGYVNCNYYTVNPPWGKKIDTSCKKKSYR